MLAMIERRGPRTFEAMEATFKDRALCRDPGVPTAIFFPYPTGYRAPLPKHNPDSSPLLAAERRVAAEALALCRRCPEREPCLAYALAAREEEGVWGGTTPTERRLMVRVKRVRR